MTSFAEFESAFLDALQNERSDLQSLQGASEAQLSAWIEHVFRQYLGYTHWKEISRGEGTPIGSKGGKQLFPDLRIDILDNGLIFVECKKMGRLDGAKRQEELDDGLAQLKSYMHAHLDRANIKPKTALGVVTDGNRWHLIGVNKFGQFHPIAEWSFLTDDPRLLGQRLWLLAKPALAQPTSALVEFLARRTVVDVLREKTGWLTKKVNERLPGGTVSEELIGRWLRDAFSDLGFPPQPVPPDSSTLPITPPPSPPPKKGLKAPQVRILKVLAAAEKSLDRKAISKLAPCHSQLVIEYIGGSVINPEREAKRGWQRLIPLGFVEASKVEIDGRLRRGFKITPAGREALAIVLGQSPPQDETNSSTEDHPERYGLRKRFWEGLLSRPNAMGTRHAKIKPGEYHWIAAGSGMRGMPYLYVVRQDKATVELYIDRGQKEPNKRIFDRLHEQRKEIDRAFGGELSWERLNDKRACRIAYTVSAGGYKSDESRWPTIHDAMIDAMMRLENALALHLKNLKTE